jgi:drug/metabolite transporter (DMT)-like permease
VCDVLTDGDERTLRGSTSGRLPACPTLARQNVGVTIPQRRPPSTAAVVVALLIVYLVWGSTYLAIALMIETMPPLLAAGVRFAAAGVIMLAFLAARRLATGASEDDEPVRWIQWRSAIVIGALLLFGGNGGVVLAEQYIPSGIAAVIIATVPIWMAAFDAAVTRRRPSWLVIGGLLAGIAGVAVLLVPVEGLAEVNPIGIGLCVAAAFFWAAGSIYARHAPLPRSGVLASGMELVGGGAVLLVVGSLLGEVGEANAAAFSMSSILALAYLIVFGSIVAFTAYTWLLANAAVSTVGTYAYVNPVVAVALGAVFLAEPITPRTLVASAIIIGAVVAMVSGRPRGEERAPAVRGSVAGLEPD